MPKSETRKGRPIKTDAALARLRVAVPGRRIRPAEPDEAPSRPARVAATRLAAEVERLELELAAARAEIAALSARADTDPLTAVLNRRGFERELKRSLAYLKRYDASAALLYVDLDGFKAINDRHGHAAGDAVLKAVSMVIARHVRSSDLVARIGGDEFAVLLWNVTDADARTKADSLEAAIARMTASHGGSAISVGASVGAVWPRRSIPQRRCLIGRTPPCMRARPRVAPTGPPPEPSCHDLGVRKFLGRHCEERSDEAGIQSIWRETGPGLALRPRPQ